jgi:hypothetical protein
LVLGFLLKPVGFSWSWGAFLAPTAAIVAFRPFGPWSCAYVPFLPTAWCTVTFMPGAPMQSRWQRFKLWLARRISNRKY